MFYSRTIGNEYFLSSDTSVGEYGPFYGVYIKNTAYGNINTLNIDLKKYPSHKYVFGVGKTHLFVVSGAGILSLIPLQHVPTTMS